MVWLASLLMFLLVAGGLIGIAVFRHKLRSDDDEVEQLPPDVLISIARSREAELAARKTDVAPPRAEPERAGTNGPFRDA